MPATNDRKKAASQELERLEKENAELRGKLAEAEEALEAIRGGKVDAILVDGGQGAPQVYSLSGAETVYRLAVETMGEGALNVTPEGRILFCNQRFADFVRTPIHHAAGRLIEEFLEPRTVAPFRALLKAGQDGLVRMRVVFRAPDGTLTPTRLSCHPLVQGDAVSLCLIATDLTELEETARELDRLLQDRRIQQSAEAEMRDARLAALNLMEDAVQARQRAEETAAALRESEERFRGTFENAAVGIAHQAPDGQWLRVNARLCDITGYRREELLQKTFADITHPEDVEVDLAQAQRLLAGEIPSYAIEKRYLRADGSSVWVAITVSLVRRRTGEPDHLIKIVRDVSQRKQAEEDLAASQQRLAGIVESAMDAIISVNANQRIVLFNRAAETMFGCPEGEALGSPIDRFIPARFQAEHRSHVVSFGANGVTNRATGHWGGALRAVRACGEEFPIEASISRTEAAGEQLLTVILRDITERLRAEHSLRESEERLRLAAEATGFGTYDHDLTAGESTWSAELYAICGLPRTVIPSEEVMRQLVYPDDLDAFQAMLRKALEPGEPRGYSLEFRIRRKDGNVLWVRNVGRSFIEMEHGRERENGRVVRVIGTLQDVTTRKQAELKLKASMRELRETQDQMVRQERLATLGQLAGSVAHELRTPLNVITNSAYYLRGAIVPQEEEPRDSLEEKRKALDEMERAVRSSDLIISEMLDFVREPSPHKSNFPIGEAIQRALELVPVPPKVEVTVAAEGAGLRVHANQDQITRILINLIQNGFQAMANGGRLDIAAEVTKEERVRVKVRDTGCGIPEENLPKIFEPLYSTKTKGIGLGLAISSRYAKQNKGWLFAESRVGQGTTFWLILLPAHD